MGLRRSRCVFTHNSFECVSQFLCFQPCHAHLITFPTHSQDIELEKKRVASSLPPTGGVKSTSPGTENHDQNGYGFQDNSKKFIITNVDSSNTTYTKKNDTNNHNAHNLHKCLHHVSHNISRSRVCHRHLHAIHVSSSFILFDLSLYFHLHFTILVGLFATWTPHFARFVTVFMHCKRLITGRLLR